MDLLQLNSTSEIVLIFHCDSEQYYAKAYRTFYLSTYAEDAKLYFKKSGTIGCFYGSKGLSKYIPINLILDLYGITHILEINLKETDVDDYIPENHIQVQDRVLNGWKESCYILNGTNNQIVSLNKSQKDDLLNSFIQSTMENWNWLSIVVNDPTNIPLKLFYIQNDKLKMIVRQFKGDEKLKDLATLFHFQQAKCCGILLDINMQLSQLLSLISCDGFLYFALFNVKESEETTKSGMEG